MQQAAALVPHGVAADELDAVRLEQAGHLAAHAAAECRQRPALRADDDERHAEDLALAQPGRGLQGKLVERERPAVSARDDERDAAVMTGARLDQHLLEPRGVTSALELHRTTNRGRHPRPDRDHELVVGLGRPGAKRDRALVGVDGRKRIANEFGARVGRNLGERISVVASLVERGEHLVGAHDELRIGGDQRKTRPPARAGLQREQCFHGRRPTADDDHARGRSHGLMLTPATRSDGRRARREVRRRSSFRQPSS